MATFRICLAAAVRMSAENGCTKLPRSNRMLDHDAGERQYITRIQGAKHSTAGFPTSDYALAGEVAINYS